MEIDVPVLNDFDGKISELIYELELLQQKYGRDSTITFYSTGYYNVVVEVIPESEILEEDIE